MIVNGGSFGNNPGTVYVHENQDSTYNVWTIQATCTVTFAVPYTCYYASAYSCGYESCWWSLGFKAGCSTSYRTCYTVSSTTCYEVGSADYDCTECSITSNPNSLFQMSGSMTVQKKACQDSGCTSCSISDYCLTTGQSYSVQVQCWRYSSSYLSYGYISESFTVSITSNTGPTFTFSESDAITVRKSQSGAGTVVNTVQGSDSDAYIDNDYIRYGLDRAPGSSYIHQNVLFDLDTSNGNVYVTQSLQSEFSYTFDMRVCIWDRRGAEYCRELDITLIACYQTPNCTDQSITIWDTHGLVTGHGTTDTLFDAIFALPSYHFPNFRSSWLQLIWTFDSDGGLTSSSIDVDSGEIYLHTNISIWPSHPTKSFTQTVRVANSESCYSTTCTMSILVYYTNWDPHIVSLPTTNCLHEDTDWRWPVHYLEIYDYNYYWEDNITCHITHVYDVWGENDMELFDLEQDDPSNLNSWNSYTLYKTACDYPGCGYKYENYTCPKHSGCMTHNVTQSYNVEIYCVDGYGADDIRNFTHCVSKNQAPVWRNLPKHIDIDANAGSQHDIVFSIMYSDAENEALIYEYQFREDVHNVDPGYFEGSPTGNYYNNLGNITLTTYLWNEPTNTSYTIQICGHERRNERCEYLTVDLEEYCSETPDCSNAGPVSFSEETPIGTELFDVSDHLVSTYQSTLSYSMAASRSDLFDIDSSTGKITSVTALPADYPSSTYYINAYVDSTDSCGYGHCTLELTVTAINYAPSIENLPYTVSVLEDQAMETTLFILTTSDQNEEDAVTCNDTDPVGVQPFVFEETSSKSGIYIVKNRENANLYLSSDKLEYLINIQCFDPYGESATGTLTIDVIPNEGPTLNHLSDSDDTLFDNRLQFGTLNKVVDQSTQFSGTTLLVEQASDNEGDDLTYTCTVASSLIPLECEQVGQLLYIKLRRNVSIVTEADATYAITVAVGDAKHVDHSTGILSVTFTSNHSYPSLSNLPDTIEYTEDTAVGTTLFDVDVDDDDLPEETHVFNMTVDPVSATSNFQLNVQTGVLTLWNALDYETTSSYTFTFSVKDNYLTSLQSEVLIFTVTNSNEENSITASVSAITFYESAPVGTSFDFGIQCTDADLNDALTLDIASGDHVDFFSINSKSGKIYLEKEWDLEGPDQLSDSTSLTIRCTDSGGLTSTTLVTFYIENVNDQDPELSFVLPAGQSDLTFNVNKDTPLTQTLLTLTAYDGDANGGSDSFTFDILGSGIGKQYFRIEHSLKRSTSSEAFLKLKKHVDFSNDKMFQITIKVTDGDVSGLSDGLTININYTAGDPVTETDSSSVCLTCTTNGRILIGILVAEGVIVAVLVAHFIFNMTSRRGNATGIRTFKSDVAKNRRWKPPPRTENVPKVTSKQDKSGRAVNETSKKSTKSDLSSSSSSSSSSSDDNDDESNPRVAQIRSDIGRSSFRPMFRPTYSRDTLSNRSASTALPQSVQVNFPAPIYSSGNGGIPGSII